jgi:hypothetical protein
MTGSRLPWVTGRSVGALAGMYERGMRVRLRDRLWEIEEIRGAGPGTFLDLRRADERPGPVRLTVLAALEPSLTPEPVGFQNSATGLDLGFYAARSYSLRRPPRTGRRLIRPREGSATG